ncbi:MAG: iron-containing alcohol dehydrogenase [Kiritimatiellae bacterium]|nr:iron-containing alcohol dehydrogenase [Kiritimatiellia bacterium]
MQPQAIVRDLPAAKAALEAFRGATPVERVLLVGDGASWNATGARRWFEANGFAGMSSFFDFSPNPKESDVARGVEAWKAAGAEKLLAVGGGSAIDMAKLVGFFAANDVGLEGALALEDVGAMPPFFAFPTTAGTGSEATHFAVCYRGREKFSVAHPLLRPQGVGLFAEWTASMPPTVAAASGMDALAHGIESWWAKGATAESRAWAEKAIRGARANLAAAVNAPTPEVRRAMLEAAHAGGEAINISKTTAGHAYSYILSATFRIPHGRAVGILLPHFLRLAEGNGLANPWISSAEAEALLEETGLAAKLPTDADSLEKLLSENVNRERLGNHPFPVPGSFVRSLAESLAAS